MLRAIAIARQFGTIVEDVETGQVFTLGDTVADAGRTGILAQSAVMEDGSLLLSVVYPAMAEPVAYSTRHGDLIGWWDARDLTPAG